MSTPSRPRATKIICTIGPATDTSDMLGQLIEAGANVFRLNMSHSKHDWVREVVFRIRRKAAELQANIAILFDLQGPSIRTGDLPEPYHLKKGDTLEIRLSTAKPELPFSTTVNYDGLLQDVQVGHTMVVDNGGILMRIEEVRPDRLICKVLTEGVFGSRRHINLPGVALRLPALTEKDLAGPGRSRGMRDGLRSHVLRPGRRPHRPAPGAYRQPWRKGPDCRQNRGPAGHPPH